MKPRTLVAAALAAFTPPSAAQLPNLPTIGRNWTEASYPKLYFSSRDGLTAGLYYAQVRPKRFADFYTPPPYLALLSLDGSASTAGSWQVTLRGHFPALIEGWRLTSSLEFERRARARYFGLGNATTWNRDSATAAQPHFYDADARSILWRTSVQRRLAGPLRALAGFHLERWRFDTLDGPSRLATDARSGAAQQVGTAVVDGALRFGLVFDTRDDEIGPRRGILAEAIVGIADSALIGDLTYTRFTLSAAGYLRALPHVTLSARMAIQSLSGSPGLGTLALLEQSERQVTGLGGPSSHRGLVSGRFLGEDQIVTNFDVRWDAFEAPTIYRVTILAFLDAGRVYYNEPFRLTTAGLHVGGGGGVFVQLFRAAVLGTTLAAGPDGPTLHLYSQWTY